MTLNDLEQKFDRVTTKCTADALVSLRNWATRTFCRVLGRSFMLPFLERKGVAYSKRTGWVLHGFWLDLHTNACVKLVELRPPWPRFSARLTPLELFRLPFMQCSRRKRAVVLPSCLSFVFSASQHIGHWCQSQIYVVVDVTGGHSGSLASNWTRQSVTEFCVILNFR